MMTNETQTPKKESTPQQETSLEFSPRVLEILETLDEVFVMKETAKPFAEKELASCC